MKLYDFKMAPNARRVRMFIAEKGLDIEKFEVDLGTRAQLGDYRQLNPLAEVPALELDDGTILTESTAICRYLEEVYPDPPLVGRNPLERAQVMMWDRRVEQHGFAAVAEGFRNSSPVFKDRSVTGPADFPQIPELAERGKARFANFLVLLEQRLGESEFVSGARFAIADITALVTIDFARTIKAGIGDDQANLKRWYAAVSTRESAKA
ncbi:glutathione S-transferase family protein [Iodidimonas sp. SYSU 1G8]|uniref:glutathione S-transferase family protein n=1 Tax=Iodidimonas sp. SYSU 1G8 TaxID=3133967 RepID=UPI0031FE9D06